MELDMMLQAKAGELLTRVKPMHQPTNLTYPSTH